MDGIEQQSNTELWNTIGRMLTTSNDDEEFAYEVSLIKLFINWLLTFLIIK
jgi:hypothetical protein